MLKFDCVTAKLNCVTAKLDCDGSTCHCVMPKLNCVSAKLNCEGFTCHCVVPICHCVMPKLDCVTAKLNCEGSTCHCVVPTCHCTLLGEGCLRSGACRREGWCKTRRDALLGRLYSIFSNYRGRSTYCSPLARLISSCLSRYSVGVRPNSALNERLKYLESLKPTL